jgi:general stress protein 26
LNRQYAELEKQRVDPSLRQEILSILQGANDMTIATAREDGYPHATTVSYVSDGLAIYFGCAAESQKSINIARSCKVSLTVNLPYSSWDEIRRVSIGGRAARVTDPKEMDRVGELMLRKFPQITQYASTGMQGIILLRITPEIISVLDYRKGLATPNSSGFSPTGSPICAASRRS